MTTCTLGLTDKTRFIILSIPAVISASLLLNACFTSFVPSAITNISGFAERTLSSTSLMPRFPSLTGSSYTVVLPTTPFATTLYSGQRSVERIPVYLSITENIPIPPGIYPNVLESPKQRTVFMYFLSKVMFQKYLSRYFHNITL